MMKNFLKRNKFVILSYCLLIIILFSYLYSVSAQTYESLDFKYGKVIAKTSLNIRCGPSTNYSRIGKLNNGDYINVFAKVGDWYIIQTDENLVGAVSSKYVEAVYDETEVLDKGSSKELKNEEIAEASGVENGTNEFADSLELTSEEQEFLNLINSKRKESGLEELKVDNTVQNVARLKAEDLNRNDYFSHKSPSYRNYWRNVK